MAVPKRKTTTRRRDTRRTHWKLDIPAMAKCDHCGSTTRPHRVCTICGFYAGVEIIRPKKIA